MAKTVVVVDDDPDFLGMLEAVLQPAGYGVVPCLESTAVYQKAQQLRPDVIILDLLMPGQSGWQIIEQLKADPQTARISVIVCTAAVSDAMQQVAKLRQWGCQVLLKPFELRDLLSMVAKATAQRKPCNCR